MIITDKGIWLEESEKKNTTLTGSDIVIPHSRVNYAAKVAKNIYYDAKSSRAVDARLQVKKSGIEIYPLLETITCDQTGLTETDCFGVTGWMENEYIYEAAKRSRWRDRGEAGEKDGLLSTLSDRIVMITGREIGGGRIDGNCNLKYIRKLQINCVRRCKILIDRGRACRVVECTVRELKELSDQLFRLGWAISYAEDTTIIGISVTEDHMDEALHLMIDTIGGFEFILTEANGIEKRYVNDHGEAVEW